MALELCEWLSDYYMSKKMSSRLSDWQNADTQRDWSHFRDCQDWQETDSPPILNSTGIYCLGNSWNSLENFLCISSIRLKFSREFVIYTAITWQKAVSLLSVLTVSKKTANALHIGVLSVWQSSFHFYDLVLQKRHKYAGTEYAQLFQKKIAVLT